MGVAWKLSLPRPPEWKITSFTRLGVAGSILKPHPYPFRFTQRDTRAIISETFIKLSSPILKWQKFEFWILKKSTHLYETYTVYQKFTPNSWPTLQNVIFWPNSSQDHKLHFLTFIPNAPRIVNLKGHGCGIKIKVPTPFFLENHLFCSKMGVFFKI